MHCIISYFQPPLSGAPPLQCRGDRLLPVRPAGPGEAPGGQQTLQVCPGLQVRPASSSGLSAGRPGHVSEGSGRSAAGGRAQVQQAHGTGGNGR